MRTTINFFVSALCAMLIIGVWLTIGKESGTSGGFVQSPHPVTGLTATGTVRSIAGVTAPPQIAEVYGKLPLSFEQNQGQSARRVKFHARGRGYGLFLTSTEAILTLGQATPKPETSTSFSRNQSAGTVKPARMQQDSAPQQPAVLRIMLAGANRAIGVTGLDELPGKANYFLGNDPKKWHTNVPTYARVKYENVYPGVHLIYYGNQQDLESDFVVAPGANPGAIRLKFQGVRSISISNEGDLVLKIHGGETLLRKPVAYQTSSDDEFPASGTGKHIVAARYVLKGPREVGFAVEAYDSREPLIIDPVLAYSTYLGGSGTEFAVGGIAVDAAGNAYVAGYTNSTDFPTLNPFQSTCYACSINSADAFVTKVNAAGNALVYSTYLGGSNLTVTESIAVDAVGNAYVAGVTYSTDFPTANPAQATYGGDGDAFVTKLNSAGDGLVYSTYLGGSSVDNGEGIAVDTAGNAYVVGKTGSTDFPTVNPFQSACGGCDDAHINAFVAKFNSAGNALVYSTYLGGSVSCYEPYGSGIAVDAAGSAYVTGSTTCSDFPTLNPFQSTLQGSLSAFVTKFNAVGNALIYSTYLGGSAPGQDVAVATSGGTGIAVDSAGNAWVTGETQSANFPTANPFQANLRGGFMNAFVTKFNAAGNALTYSTYLGGSGHEIAYGIALDAGSNAYVTGYTTSTDFPLADPFQSTCISCKSGGSNAFVTQFNGASNAPVYSTYLGGSSSDLAFGIAVDTAGNAYVAGSTLSPDFPTVNPLQSTYGGNQDDFVAKISPTTDFSITSSAPSQTISAGRTVTYPLTIVGSNGFSGTVSLACKGAPQGSNCSISPNPVNVSGTNASNATVTVFTTARASSSADMIQRILFPSPRLWAALGCIPAFAFVFIGAPRRRFRLHRRGSARITAVLLFAMLSFGCSGGSSSSGAQSGTPAGTYTITVTGTSGSLTHIVNLTLKVN